jgi:hypothetical protein
MVEVTQHTLAVRNQDCSGDIRRSLPHCPGSEQGAVQICRRVCEQMHSLCDLEATGRCVAEAHAKAGIAKSVKTWLVTGLRISCMLAASFAFHKQATWKNPLQLQKLSVCHVRQRKRGCHRDAMGSALIFKHESVEGFLLQKLRSAIIGMTEA